MAQSWPLWALESCLAPIRIWSFNIVVCAVTRVLELAALCFTQTSSGIGPAIRWHFKQRHLPSSKYFVWILLSLCSLPIFFLVNLCCSFDWSGLERRLRGAQLLASSLFLFRFVNIRHLHCLHRESNLENELLFLGQMVVNCIHLFSTRINAVHKHSTL